MNKCADSENSCSYKLYIQGTDTEVRQEKRKYKSSDEAIRIAMYMNMKEATIHKFVAYKCIKCGYYHIGHTSKLLSEKDRKKAKQFIEYNFIIKKNKNGYTRKH